MKIFIEKSDPRSFYKSKKTKFLCTKFDTENLPHSVTKQFCKTINNVEIITFGIKKIYSKKKLNRFNLN